MYVGLRRLLELAVLQCTEIEFANLLNCLVVTEDLTWISLEVRERERTRGHEETERGKWRGETFKIF